MGYLSSGEQQRAEAKEAAERAKGSTFSGIVKESEGGKPSSTSAYVNGQKVSTINENGTGVSYLNPNQTANIQTQNENVKVTSSMYSTTPQQLTPIQMQVLQSTLQSIRPDLQSHMTSQQADQIAEQIRQNRFGARAADALKSFGSQVVQYLKNTPLQVPPYAYPTKEGLKFVAGQKFSDIKQAIDKSNFIGSNYAKAAAEFLPTNLFDLGIGAASVAAFDLIPAEILYSTVFPSLSAYSVTQRMSAKTPEERAAANLNIGLTLTPYASVGLNELMKAPKAIPIREGEPVRYEVTGKNGETFIVEKPANYNELLTDLKVIQQKQIGENTFEMGQAGIVQVIPETYKLTSPSRIADIFFGRTQEVNTGPKINVIKSVEPITSFNGELINSPLFEGSKPGSSYANKARLGANTFQVSLRDFSSFSRELQRQIIEAYQQQTGQLINEQTFAKVFANSDRKVTVSNVESVNVGRYTNKGKGVIEYRYPPQGRTLTRTQFFDESKLDLTGDLVPVEVYSTKTSFRDITMPEINEMLTEFNKKPRISRGNIKNPDALGFYRRSTNSIKLDMGKIDGLLDSLDIQAHELGHAKADQAGLRGSSIKQDITIFRELKKIGVAKEYKQIGYGISSTIDEAFADYYALKKGMLTDERKFVNKINSKSTPETYKVFEEIYKRTFLKERKLGFTRTPRLMEGKTIVIKPQPTPEPLGDFNDVVVKQDRTQQQVKQDRTQQQVKQDRTQQQVKQKQNLAKAVKRANEATTSIVNSLLPQRRVSSYVRPSPRVVKGTLGTTATVVGLGLANAPRIAARTSQSNVNDVLTAQRTATRLATDVLTLQRSDTLTRTLIGQSTAQQTRQQSATKLATDVLTLQRSDTLTRLATDVLTLQRSDTLTRTLIGQSTAQQTRQTPRQGQPQVFQLITPQKQNTTNTTPVIPVMPKTPRSPPNVPPTLYIPYFKRGTNRPIIKGRKKRTVRGYSLSPTLGNVLTGQHRAKPIKLSRLTGFENLTI